MKNIVVILVILLAFELNGQTITRISIVAHESSSTYFKPELKRSVDSAFTIASAILSSQDFVDKINPVKFPGWNRCKPGKCKPTRKYGEKDSLSASEVFTKIYNKQSVVLAIFLEEKSNSSLGSTCPAQYATTAYFNNIVADMNDIPWAFAIAANLCHEFMHHIGFCHWSNSFDEPDKDTPDPVGFKSDLAYRVGWETYYIAKNWFLTKKEIKGL